MHHRLALLRRSIARPASIGASSSPPALLLLRRPYASKTPGAPKQKQNFDKIMASLRPDMKTDEFARKMAALLVLSQHDQKLHARMVAAVRPLVHAPGVRRALLSKKVDLYMDEPPDDGYDAFVESLDAPPEEDTRYTGLPKDPSLEHPGTTLENHLKDLRVQQKLASLPIVRRADMVWPLKRLEGDPSDMSAYIELARLFDEFGVPIAYQRRTVPLDLISDESTDSALDEVRELIDVHEREIAAEDPEVAAEMAAEEAALLRKMQLPRTTPPPSSTNNNKNNKNNKNPKSQSKSQSEAGAQAQEPRRTLPAYPYPDLMTPDPLLDSRDVLELPPDGKEQIFHNRVIVRNHTSIFHEAMEERGFDFHDPEYLPTATDETEESASSLENLPLSPSELQSLYRFPLVRRRVTQQTGKGKIHRMYVLMVVGNGNGMVGLGQGKDDDATRAEAKAYAQAVRNMDWVERFEKRTIWTDMESKLGSTQLLLRPRPVGFGLRCNPNLHQVLKAAGIKDISAKVWGSRNPINVIKAAFRVLQAGHAPLGMGDGIGGKGRKLNKGSGLRSKEDVERERGRQLINLRKQ